MQVRATQMGYYDLRRRREGDLFVLTAYKRKDADGKVTVVTPEMQFNKKWMELAGDEPITSKRPRPQYREAQALSKMREQDVPVDEPTGDTEAI